MWAKFTLDSLIESWSNDENNYEVLINTNEGAINSLGIYEIPEEIWLKGYGVICNMTNLELRKDIENAYSEHDRILITMDNYKLGSYVRTIKGIEYIIEDIDDYSSFNQVDLNKYILRRRSTRKESNVR